MTNPDSRRAKGNGPHIQGHNSQAAVTEQQIVIAAEITPSPPPDGGKRDGTWPGTDRQVVLVHARSAADRAGHIR